MSYKATAWAYDMELSSPMKPVLVALADMADEAGTCFPGQERLAFMTGLSVSTVARSLGKLETLGLIERRRRSDGYGHRTSDRFVLHLTVTAPESLPVIEPTRQRAYKADSQSLTVTQPIPNRHSDGGTISEPSEEPSDTSSNVVGQSEPKSPYSRDFEEWWGHYPRRESKGDAFNAWKVLKKAKTLPEVAVLIAAAESYARREQRPEFRKLPAGWLRARKWEDETAQSENTSNPYGVPRRVPGKVYAVDMIEANA